MAQKLSDLTPEDRKKVLNEVLDSLVKLDEGTKEDLSAQARKADNPEADWNIHVNYKCQVK